MNVIAFVVVAFIAIFLTDLSLPLGLAGGIPYVAVILLAWWFGSVRNIYFLAVVASILTILGFFYSPEGGVLWVVITNRGLALFAIWAAAFLLANAKRSALRLEASEIERAKIASASLAQLIGDNSHEILIFNVELTKIVRASQRARENLGYSESELSTLSPPDLMLDVSQEEITDLAKQMQGGMASNRFLDTSLIRKDGSHYPVELHIFNTLDVEPQVLVCFVSDDPNQNRMLGRIVENSINEIYVFESETLLFIQANHGARENLGYTNEELRKMTPVDIKPEFTCESFEEKISPLRDGSESQIVFETIHRRKDGTDYHVEVRLQLASERKPQAFFAIVLDITARKTAERELQDREARQSAILRTATDAIISTDEKGIVSQFNPAAERMFGYGADEMLGRNIDLLVPAHYHAEHNTSMARYLKTGESQIIGKGREVEGLHKDGSLFPVDLALATWELDGETMFTAAIRDMSDQRAVEEALAVTRSDFQSLMENSPVSIALKDTEHRFLRVGNEFLRRYGLDIDDVIGKSSENVLPAETAAKSMAQERAVLETGGVVIEEYESKFASGEIHMLNTTMFPIRGPGGTIRGIAAISVDVTAQRHTEEQLRQSNKMEALGRLAGGVAHEFNNLLLPIITLTELSLEDMDDVDEVTKNLETVLSAARKGKSLIARILGFSRQQPSDRRQVVLKETIAEAVTFVRITVPARIKVRSHLDELDEPIFVDPAEIHQVVLNLAANAAKAIGSEAGEIEIRLRQANSNGKGSRTPDGLAAGKYAVLTVRDTGCGMEKEVKAKIFDPLFTTQPSGHGTGMGLSIVHAIVEGHEGMISVDSQPGKGTTFKIFLPLKKPSIYEGKRILDGAAYPDAESGASERPEQQYGFEGGLSGGSEARGSTEAGD